MPQDTPDDQPDIHNPAAEGVTPSERYLKRLCNKSFLRLWTFSGLFRNQKPDAIGDGKEVCDLLVLFENHLLIFSDKYCVCPMEGDIGINWSRWYRKAVYRSGRQIFGAERWIKEHPDRLFLDRACTKPFPLAFPSAISLHIHRIAVAHGAAKACRAFYKGSGTLMLNSRIAGDRHFLITDSEFLPFCVGQIDPSQGFVHIFDEESIGLVLQNLDTITDFIGYLEARERLFTQKNIIAPGEEDMLALYLSRGTDNKHDFVLPDGFDGIGLEEGFWEDFEKRSERIAKLNADKISYSWDELIEEFVTHAIGHSQQFTSHPDDPYGIEVGLRFMAREPRVRRRMLATAIIELIFSGGPSYRVRTIFPSNEGDPHYVFLAVRRYANKSEEEYREVRRNLLEHYCVATKKRIPTPTHIVGIATECESSAMRSEDLLYVDASQLSQEEVDYSVDFLKSLGLFKENLDYIRGTVKEYPDKKSLPPEFRTHQKRVGRNDPCPCSSGKKYKECCLP